MAWQHQTFRQGARVWMLNEPCSNRACFSPRGARERRAPPEIPGRRTLLLISARLGTGRARVQNPYGSAPCIVVSRTAFPTCLSKQAQTHFLRQDAPRFRCRAERRCPSQCDTYIFICAHTAVCAIWGFSFLKDRNLWPVCPREASFG